MSLDRLKKRAKNAQKLLAEVGGHGPVKLSAAQEFVAREDGYPNWKAACDAQSQDRSQHAPKKNTPETADYWAMRYSEFADTQAPIIDELRIMTGVETALLMMFYSCQEFDKRQEYPGRPEDFALELQPCAELGAATRECLRLKYPGARRRVEVIVYPLEPKVVMVDLAGPASADIDPEITAALNQRKDLRDMKAVLAAAAVTYNDMKASLVDYHKAHPVKNAFLDLQGFLKEKLDEMSATQGPREGLWTCDEIRLGSWRFRLLFTPEDDHFDFDAFDEAGGTGSLTWDCETTVIKRKPSGQWCVTTRNGPKESVVLTGVTDDALQALEEIAADWGIELSVDGVRKRSALPNGTSPGQLSFLANMRKERPEVLAGGKFA